jgi:hypothetical protein
MRERPNRHAWKACVGPAHRGFESHSLRPVVPDGPDRPGLLVLAGVLSGWVHRRTAVSGTVAVSVAVKPGASFEPFAVGGQQDPPGGGHRRLPAESHILTLRNRAVEAAGREPRHPPARRGQGEATELVARCGTAAHPPTRALAVDRAPFPGWSDKLPPCLSVDARSSSVVSFGKEVRHEPVEVVGALDRHDVGGAVSSDDLESCARDCVGDLACDPRWRQ